MKKTLIAMAAVAVAGTAAAQVTITGAVGGRYETQTTAAGTETKGFYMSDAAVKFSASEDLGGGLTASASFGLDGMTINNAAGATNTGSALAVTAAGAGTFSISNVEAGDYLPVDVITDSNFSNGGTADRISFKSESINGLTLTVTYSDGLSGAGHTSGSTSTVYELDYATGAFAANFGMMKVDKQTHATSDSGSRVKVSYDAGVAKVTYGSVNETEDDQTDVKQTGWTVTAPVGPLSVSASMVSSKRGTNAKLNGSVYSASYALSKRTALAVEKMTWDTATAGVNPQRTRVTLSHAF
jgi:predicted porin